MQIQYNDQTDLLYFRLDPVLQDVVNQTVGDDVVLDIGENNHIVGIEIMNASRRLDLAQLLPVQHLPKAA